MAPSDNRINVSFIADAGAKIIQRSGTAATLPLRDVANRLVGSGDQSGGNGLGFNGQRDGFPITYYRQRAAYDDVGHGVCSDPRYDRTGHQ